ncbi:MAG TPA: hypothetical protein VJ838_06095 [Gaiellaceae bacterium]|nr:hypothetical protein [Gaiellaceae bacterium]
MCETDLPAVTEPNSNDPADDGDHRSRGVDRAAPVTTPRARKRTTTQATTNPRVSRALPRTRDMSGF